MSNQLGQSSSSRPLRLWPGVVIVVFLILARFVLPKLFPEATVFGMPLLFLGVMVGLACGILLVIWWLFFSRAPWSERIFAVLLMVAGIFITRYLVHVSIRGGAMGFLMFILIIPAVSIAFVIWALATRNLSTGIRRVTLVAAIVISCGIFTLMRTNGMTGEGNSDLKWRWSQTDEEKLLAQQNEKEEPIAPAPSTKAPEQTQPEATVTQTQEPQTKIAEVKTEPAAAPTPEINLKPIWPGFRGPNRDGVVKGVRINTDWSTSPPKELWRRQIGPAWSSITVAGNLLFTQEQRGDNEDVSCYRLSTGKPVWKHHDPVRFYESNAGAGPRGTPTYNNGRIYAFGATGILNALNATDGSVIWSRNVSKDSKRKVPMWGFSSSPLVVDDVVIVAAAGKLVAYDTSDGNPRWYGPDDPGGYSSPHLATIDGSKQVLFTNAAGVTAFAPETGKKLWNFKLGEGTRIVQPAVIQNADLLVGDGEGKNIRRIAVTHESSKWDAKERWTSIGLKPYFNDFVVHNGYAYGFDGAYISCIDLNDGAKKWKGGKYGAGQLILLADQDVLLVVSEQGDIALVSATPDQFKELGHVPAISGKTWNHPALANDILLVRNGEEMAAFKLALEQ
jgi:outer membrane protein assembly factor BamB